MTRLHTAKARFYVVQRGDTQQLAASLGRPQRNACSPLRPQQATPTACPLPSRLGCGAKHHLPAYSPRQAQRLRALAIQAYWAASTPLEAKMAGILLDLFAPDVAERA